MKCRIIRRRSDMGICVVITNVNCEGDDILIIRNWLRSINHDPRNAEYYFSEVCDVVDWRKLPQPDEGK